MVDHTEKHPKTLVFFEDTQTDNDQFVSSRQGRLWEINVPFLPIRLLKKIYVFYQDSIELKEEEKYEKIWIWELMCPRRPPILALDPSPDQFGKLQCLGIVDKEGAVTPRPYTRLQKQENTFIDDIAKILDEFDEGWGWKLQSPVIARNLRHGTVIEDAVDFLDAYDSLQDDHQKDSVGQQLPRILATKADGIAWPPHNRGH
ncbi:hypothetical protein N7467_005696 [Penicillium canescens]|nr:hypothetical protein N7467_005696 [Penicillium canescens]